MSGECNICGGPHAEGACPNATENERAKWQATKDTCTWLKFGWHKYVKLECGHELYNPESDFKFCPYCGKLIVTIAATTEAQ